MTNNDHKINQNTIKALTKAISEEIRGIYIIMNIVHNSPPLSSHLWKLVLQLNKKVIVQICGLMAPKLQTKK